LAIELIASFVLAFVRCYVSMPSIIRIAKRSGIVDIPSKRKAHSTSTPRFGGVGIFVSAVLITLLLIPANEIQQIRFVLAALAIIFLVGARDDLDPLRPLAKLLGQLCGVALLIFFANIRLTSFYGLFGIYELPEVASILITATLFIYLINSFNLIDGIDALCASTSIFILSISGIWFFMVDDFAFALLALTTAGGTVAFLRYNISPSKIFMGDTGSLVLGTICSVLVIRFMETAAGTDVIGTLAVSNIAIGLLVLPAFDTIRVFALRLWQGRSPFEPDKTHMHHLLLQTGLTHMQSTALLLIANIAFFGLSVQMHSADPTFFLIVAAVLAILFTVGIHLAIALQSSQSLRTDP